MQEWIPNINIGKDYDQRYIDANIHYDVFGNLADFFGRDMPIHRHAHYVQIHYIDSGAIHFHIDEKIYQTTGPSCFLTPAAVPHSFLTEDHVGGHVITLHESFLWQLMREGLQQELSGEVEPLCIEKLSLPDDKQVYWDQLSQTFNSIAGEWLGQNKGKHLQLQAWMRILLIQLLRFADWTNAEQALPRDSARNDAMINNEELQLFQRFSRLIDSHYIEHWKLADYTARLGVSESYLNQICRRISSRPSKVLVTDRVLLEAKRLLVFTTLSANRISYQLGFKDPAYFARFFKKHCGVTALNYRKLHRQ